MKILYKENENSPFHKLGIDNLYLKEISDVSDRRLVTKKEHSHAGYEVHILTDGEQAYEIGGEIHRVSGGSFIVIPPDVRHRVVCSLKGSFKYSMTFSVKNGFENPIPLSQKTALVKEYDKSVRDTLCKISEEYRYARAFSPVLVENAVFELVVGILRGFGFAEQRWERELSDGNGIIEMAKKYINDNVEQNLSVPDVAAYCYLGEKQLTRLFNFYEKKSPAEYIRDVRIRRIECLLADGGLSIKEISRIMNFNNEYYFNTFFAKYYGMPPGEYRKTLSRN